MFAPASHASVRNLNEEQRRAAIHPSGPLLILAGAGTGKTTTLCARVAWLIDQGVPPERILLLTFTRRAAREMLSRARALVGAKTSSRFVVGGTFHSVAYRTILHEAPLLGLDGVSLFDAADAADLLDLLREENDLASMERRFPRKGTLVDIYSRTVNAQRELSEVLVESFPWCADYGEEIAGLFRAYTTRKRELNALPRRLAPLLARGTRRRTPREQDRRSVRARARRRVPGRQRAPGRDRTRPLRRARKRVRRR